MGLLVHAFRPSGLTLGSPPCSFLPSLGDAVPLVPILIMLFRSALGSVVVRASITSIGCGLKGNCGGVS
jgi:hypothetical protein